MAKISREDWVAYVADWRALDEPEALEWLLKGWVDSKEEMWVLSNILRDVFRGVLPGVIVEIEPYISEEDGSQYLIISAVDRETLVCLTADPKTETISSTWDLPFEGFRSIDELNEFVSAIVEELVRAYNERVGDKLKPT